MQITNHLSIFPFAFLDAGNVFKLDNGEVYMKIHLSDYHSAQRPDNAVHLSTGKLVHVASDTKVQWLLNASLNIEQGGHDND